MFRKSIAAAALAAGFFLGWGVTEVFNSPAGFSDAELVQELKARGWQSAATDQTEALYFFESGDVNTHE